MGFVWRLIVAADRLLRNAPSLIQIWLVEFLLIVPLTFFIGKIVDIRGTARYPGSGGTLDGTMWGALALSLACGLFFVRNLFFPRVRREVWTPASRSGPFPGGLELVVTNPAATVRYPFLSSHPAYALLLLPSIWLPLLMLRMTANLGGNVLYWRAAGYAGLAILAVMAALRFSVWYGLRRGPRLLTEWAASIGGMTAARLGWEAAWKPTLALVGLMHAIVWIPLGVMIVEEQRAIRALPEASVAMNESAPDPHIFGSDAPRLWCRVEGTVRGEPVLWPTMGTNRGGDNFRGGGVLVTLGGGGEALLLAESMGIGDLLEDLQRARRADGHIFSTGYAVNRLSEDQERYYGFQEGDFPAPDPEGRVYVIHGYP